MQTIISGANVKLEETNNINVSFSWLPARLEKSKIGVSAFLINDNNKVNSSDDFVFYLQRESKNKAVSLIEKQSHLSFNVDVTKIEDGVKKVIFAIHIRGEDNMSSLSSLSLEIENQVRFAPETSTHPERAMIFGELYKKNNDWKFRAVGQGFTKGLTALAEHFGIDLSNESIPVIIPEKTKREKIELLRSNAPTDFDLALEPTYSEETIIATEISIKSDLDDNPLEFIISFFKKKFETNKVESNVASEHRYSLKESQQKITQLENQLRSIGSHDGLSQLKRLSDKYRNFEEILDAKFSKNEITYTKYTDTVDQLYFACLDNLDRVYLRLKSVSSVGVEYLESRLSELRRAGIVDEERRSLDQRLTIYREQLELADQSLQINETALTELDAIIVKLANASINRSRTDVNINDAMSDLKELTMMTDKYERRM